MDVNYDDPDHRQGTNTMRTVNGFRSVFCIFLRWRYMHNTSHISVQRKRTVQTNDIALQISLHQFITRAPYHKGRNDRKDDTGIGELKTSFLKQIFILSPLT